MKYRQVFILWVILGVAYLALEVLWSGSSHPAMLLVGGLCGVLIGTVNQIPAFYKTPIIIQSLLGAIIVLAVEFVSGCILNLWLGLDIWDYSNLRGNIMGQICPQYGLLWLLLVPFAIWAEDTARWLIWSWKKLIDSNYREPNPEIAPYTIWSIYKEFFTLA